MARLSDFRATRLAGALALLLSGLLTAGASRLAAGEVTLDSPSLPQLRRQLDAIKADEAAERDHAQHDEQELKRLELQVQELEAREATLVGTIKDLQLKSAQAKADTERKVEDLQAHRSSAVPPSEFNAAMSRYLGTHQLTLAGDAAGGFIYDRKTAQNTFSLQFQPIFLYRLNDWILFEGSISASLPNGTAASFALPVATAQIFVNDYLEVSAGIFDQPFGDWYEDQSPLWVNRFITAPLLYGAEAIVPPTDIGLQLRGSAQWGALGQDADYTAWVANGPSFDSALPAPVIGQALNPQNNIGINTNGRAFGGRLRVYPLPLDSRLGRLELGGSTYDGKWRNSLWFNAWGVDFAYLNKNLQARGEFAQSYRQLPSGAGADNRQGWYAQIGYFLEDLPATGLEPFDDALRRLEPLVRYSGVNQRAIVAEEVTTQPGIGFSGSPSIFSPHAREVAFGLDYWIEPSIVWQTEFDLELPGSGGTLINFNGGNLPHAGPIPAPANDQAILTQLAIGF